MFDVLPSTHTLGLMLQLALGQHPATLAEPTGAERLIADAFVELTEDRERDKAWEARFEAAATAALGLPTGVAFTLDDRELHARGETLMATGSLSFARATAISLRCNFTLSLDWAVIGNAVLVAENPRSEFAREQKATRLYYRYETRTEVLAAIDSAMATLQERSERLEHFTVTTGQTFGVSPFLRVDCQITTRSTSTVAGVGLRVHAIQPLPEGTAQASERTLEDRRRHGGGDLVIGPVKTKSTVDEALDLAAAVVPLLHTLPGRSDRVTVSPNARLVTFELHVPTGGDRDALFRLALSGTVDEDPLIHWDNTPIELEQARFLLDHAKRFADEHEQQLSFAAVFPPDSPDMRCTIIVATTPDFLHCLNTRLGRVLQFDVPLDAGAISVRERAVSRVHTSSEFNINYRWTADLESGSAFWAEREFHRFCAVGMTWPPKAHLDDRKGVLVGGTTFTVGPPE